MQLYTTLQSISDLREIEHYTWKTWRKSGLAASKRIQGMCWGTTICTGILGPLLFDDHAVLACAQTAIAQSNILYSVTPSQAGSV